MLNYEFPPLGGGASPVSYEIAKGYVKLGHKVDVVTMRFKGLPNFEVKDGINIYRVKCFRSKKEICHPHEMLSYIISAKSFLKKHLKSNMYDINHTHFIIPTGIVSLWLKRRYGIPYIITSHGSDVLGYNKRFKKLYPFVVKPWKKIIKEAKMVTTPSKFLQNEIKKITKKGKFVVIPNGIDTQKFKPMKKENKILIVARLFMNKGVQDILDALKKIDIKGWQVDIIGDGPYRKFLEMKTQENGLEKVVQFHGWIDNKSQKMRNFYGHAKIFISASYFESFGLSVLEAISAGCQILVSNIQGHKQIKLNDQYYFDKGDSLTLSKKIKMLIKKQNYNKISCKKFYWDKIIKHYVQVITNA